jgi:hypothetical protein
MIEVDADERQKSDLELHRLVQHCFLCVSSSVGDVKLSRD